MNRVNFKQTIKIKARFKNNSFVTLNLFSESKFLTNILSLRTFEVPTLLFFRSNLKICNKLKEIREKVTIYRLNYTFCVTTLAQLRSKGFIDTSATY